MLPVNPPQRLPLRSMPIRTNNSHPMIPLTNRIYSVRPANQTVVHRLATRREPEIIDVESDNGPTVSHLRSPSQARYYTNYSITGEGISRPRYSLPMRRPIYNRIPMRPPSMYRAYNPSSQMVRSRVIPYIPRVYSSGGRRTLEFDDHEEEAISQAIRREEAKMQQEEGGTYFYADPEFQRIEANIVKKESVTRQQLENQRLSTLTTYQSRSLVQSEHDQLIRQYVQKFMNAPSPFSLVNTDDEIDADVKMALKVMVDNVCQQDHDNGWHKVILQKLRRHPDPPMLHSNQIMKRPTHQKHSEIRLNERTEFFKRYLQKKRARFELDVELENGFIKKTRAGALACLPCSQIYARIGKLIFRFLLLLFHHRLADILIFFKQKQLCCLFESEFATTSFFPFFFSFVVKMF